MSGAVLLLAIVFLMLLATLAGTTMQTSVLEFKMTGNALFREDAFQRAQAIAASIAANDGNFPVVGAVGFTLCKSGYLSPECDNERFVVVDTSLNLVPEGVDLQYSVERVGPARLSSLPFRVSQRAVSSSLNDAFALFEIWVLVDGSAVGLGRAEVIQGIAKRISAVAPINVE